MQLIFPSFLFGWEVKFSKVDKKCISVSLFQPKAEFRYINVLHFTGGTMKFMPSKHSINVHICQIFSGSAFSSLADIKP